MNTHSTNYKAIIVHYLQAIYILREFEEHIIIYIYRYELHSYYQLAILFFGIFQGEVKKKNQFGVMGRIGFIASSNISGT